MIVVVGGSSRDVGKTTVMCELIAATREAHWTAIKLTPHLHEPKDHGDTERYAGSGASHVLLAHDAAQISLEGNVIIESNSVLDLLTPDLFVFVDGGGEQKPSARRHAQRADVVVKAHATPELLDRVRTLLTAGHLCPEGHC